MTVLSRAWARRWPWPASCASLTVFRKTRSAQVAEVARALQDQKRCEAEYGPAHDMFDRKGRPAGDLIQIIHCDPQPTHVAAAGQGDQRDGGDLRYRYPARD
jgi:hypothetical protein